MNRNILLICDPGDKQTTLAGKQHSVPYPKRQEDYVNVYKNGHRSLAFLNWGTECFSCFFLLVRRDEIETPQVIYFEDFITKVYRYLMSYTCTELILDLLYVISLFAHGSVSIHA